MPPTSKKLRRHIGLGLSIRSSFPSVHMCVNLALGQEPVEIGSRILVCWMSMKIEKTCIFFLSIGFVIADKLPFSYFFLSLYIVSLWKFVNKISQDLLEPGS